MAVNREGLFRMYPLLLAIDKLAEVISVNGMEDADASAHLTPSGAEESTVRTCPSGPAGIRVFPEPVLTSKSPLEVRGEMLSNATEGEATSDRLFAAASKSETFVPESFITFPVASAKTAISSSITRVLDKEKHVRI